MTIKLSIAESEKFEALFSKFLEGMPEVTLDTGMLAVSGVWIDTTQDDMRKYITESFGNFLDQTTEEPEPETENDSQKIVSSIADWRLKSLSESKDVPIEDRAEFNVSIEKSAATDQVWFNVTQSNLNELSGCGDAIPTGLTGLIEIRNGKPVLSVGIEENENVIHVHSNTHNTLTIEKDSSNTQVFNDGTNVCYELKLSLLGQNRKAVADHVFQEWDFGSKTVTDSNGWCNDANNEWRQTVYLEDEECIKSKGDLVISFAEDMAWISSMKFTQ
ncbi:hypothetical protein [Vibrio crassostreae]|uniref:hypothetical protein n=1 Tax=Vibrio crassostreae TaxID=246167 RepID=UPI001B312497|nr:hypothetical protein [Vibrio crassostreae]